MNPVLPSNIADSIFEGIFKKSIGKKPAVRLKHEANKGLGVFLYNIPGLESYLKLIFYKIKDSSGDYSYQFLNEEQLKDKIANKDVSIVPFTLSDGSLHVNEQTPIMMALILSKEYFKIDGPGLNSAWEIENKDTLENLLSYIPKTETTPRTTNTSSQSKTPRLNSSTSGSTTPRINSSTSSREPITTPRSNSSTTINQSNKNQSITSSKKNSTSSNPSSKYSVKNDSPYASKSTNTAKTTTNVSSSKPLITEKSSSSASTSTVSSSISTTTAQKTTSLSSSKPLITEKSSSSASTSTVSSSISTTTAQKTTNLSSSRITDNSSSSVSISNVNSSVKTLDKSGLVQHSSHLRHISLPTLTLPIITSNLTEAMPNSTLSKDSRNTSLPTLLPRSVKMVIKISNGTIRFRFTHATGFSEGHLKEIRDDFLDKICKFKEYNNKPECFIDVGAVPEKYSRALQVNKEKTDCVIYFNYDRTQPKDSRHQRWIKCFLESVKDLAGSEEVSTSQLAEFQFDQLKDKDGLDQVTIDEFRIIDLADIKKIITKFIIYSDSLRKLMSASLLPDTLQYPMNGKLNTNCGKVTFPSVETLFTQSSFTSTSNVKKSLTELPSLTKTY